MRPPAHTAQAPSGAPAVAAAEAARYALLRRLAPSVRHHLVVNLQPIGMIYEVLDRRLRAAEPDLGDVRESARKMNRFARAALDSSVDVITWLAPEEDVNVTPFDGVHECLALIASSFSFRGFALRNRVSPLAGRVRRCAIRNVLTGALIHLSDRHAAPAEIDLSAHSIDGALVLDLALRSTEGDPGLGTAACYRALSAEDLQALAEADGARLERVGDSALRLTLPWVPAAPA